MSRLLLLGVGGKPAAGGAFSPSDIAGLTVWLKADSLSLSDDDPVGTWTDSSGEGNDASTGGDSRPRYKTGIVNGLPVVRFDGVDDNLQTDAFTGGSLSPPFTVFLLQRYRSTYSAQQGSFDGLNDLECYLFRSGANDDQYCNNGGQIGPAEGDTDQWHVLCAVVNGASSRLRYNAGTAATGTLNNEALEVARMGMRGNGDEHADVDILEVLVYDSALSTSDEQDVRDYLMGRAGI